MLHALPAALRFRFLEIAVDALTLPQLNALLDTAITSRNRTLIANHNLHSLCLYHQSAAMRSFYSAADRIHVDGISIVWLARLFGYPLRPRHRTGYMDWLPSMMQTARDKGWRVYYLGSRPGVLERGLTALRQQWPGLQIEGHHGYFDKAVGSQDNDEVLADLARYQPDLLMVGMGMPVQEGWLVSNLPHLPQSAIVACGALLDYVAGEVPTPPRWMGHLGLEWAFRLLNEPRRLSHRYLVEPWGLLPLLRKHLQNRNAAPAFEKA